MLQRNTYGYLRSTPWHRCRYRVSVFSITTKLNRINLSTRTLHMTFSVRQIYFDFIHQDESGYERSLWMSLCGGF